MSLRAFHPYQPNSKKFFCFFFFKKRRAYLAFLLLLSPPSQAQSITDLLPIAVPGFAVAPGVTTLSRLEQSDDPAGITLGVTPDDLLVYPAITASAGYDSAPGLGRSGAAMLRAQPAVRITDAALGLIAFASGDVSRYPGDQGANANDVTAGIGLDLPLGGGTLTLGVVRVGTQETALGTVQTGAAAPYGVVVTDGRAALRLPLGAFDVTTRFGVSAAALGATGSGVPAPFTARTDVSASSEIATADDGVLRLLARLNLALARYQGALPGSGVSNGSSLDLVGGAETSPNGVLRLRAVAGIAHQQFAGNASAPATIAIGSIGLGWTPDGLISAEFDLSRDSGIETTLGTQGTPVTSLHCVVANAFTRDTVLTASLDARTGTVAGHQAREIDLSLGATWHWSRQVEVVPSLSDALRHDLPGVAPREMRIMLALTWAP